MTKSSFLIETPKRLSDSLLWDLQKNYFSQKGVKAWDKEVPFFVSSNAFIATRYAQLVAQYMMDIHKTQKGPLTIVELGAGPGKFSFCFIKALEDALKDLNLNLPYQYIITDVAKKNIDFCRENEALKPYIESGKLDFGIFNVEKDSDFELTIQNRYFAQRDKAAPVVFIANYVFDVIQHDGFKIKKGELNELLVGISSRYSKFDREKPELKELKLQFATRKIAEEGYYQDSVLNEILKQYTEQLKSDKDVSFLMPTGAIHLCERLKTICDKSLLICGDLGHALLESLISEDNTLYSFDGCFAFYMNFHALGQYFNAKGGDYLATKNHNDYKICLYAQNQTFDTLPNTRFFFKQIIESMGGDEFCYLNNDFDYNNYRFGVKSCLSFLRASCFEPDTYYHLHNKLIGVYDHVSERMAQDIRNALVQVEANLYHYQSYYDVFTLLGAFYQKAKLYTKAEELYQEALKHGKDPYVPYRNLGLLYEERGNYNRALEYFRKSLSYKQDDAISKERIRAIEGSPINALKALLKTAVVLLAGAGLFYMVIFK